MSQTQLSIATVSTRNREIRAKMDSGSHLSESRMPCVYNRHGAQYAKPRKPSRYIQPYRFQRYLLYPFPKQLQSIVLLLSFSRPYTANLGVNPRVDSRPPRSLLLCFTITLVRAAQSRLPNIHRLLILLTVCMCVRIAIWCYMSKHTQNRMQNLNHFLTFMKRHCENSHTITKKVNNSTFIFF